MAGPALIRIPLLHPLPRGVAGCSLRLEESRLGELAALSGPLPPALARAVPARQGEWAAGRYAVQLACRELGVEPPPSLGARADRSPDWPSTLVGSITHKRGFVTAAVARASEVHGIGIDSEPLLPTEVLEEIRAQISLPAERSRGTSAEYYTLLFSAKESLYKCLAPLAGKFFSHQDAELIATTDTEFEMKLLVDLGEGMKIGDRFKGAYRISEGAIHTTTVLKLKLY